LRAIEETAGTKASAAAKEKTGRFFSEGDGLAESLKQKIE
jgi:hypothetical protein